MENNKYITVTQLNRYLKYKIDNDPNLGIVFLKGEISNFKNHTRGHFYFTLKDDTSRINAIMFQGNASKMKFLPVDGMKVLVTGRVSVYEASGAYQIYVDSMLEDGVGSLYLAFLQLKEKLEKEGLFKNEHKRVIPKIPQRIGIITAPTGAAIKDILSTIKRRFPLVETILFPALVQGENAKDDIVKKIKIANTYDLDVLIVGRGGGSIEDLWPFNEEIVARAIYESKIPIISAVGHEIDFTIADFVADKRAPTPTGAAEMCVPTIMDTNILINNLVIRATKTIKNMVNQKFVMLERFKRSYILKNPYSMYEIKEQKLDILIDNLKNNMENIITKKTHLYENITSSYILTNPMILIDNKSNKLDILIKSLSLLNPMSILDKGYSIVKHDDKVIKQIKDVKKGDNIDITLAKGIISAKVMEVKNGK